MTQATFLLIIAVITTTSNTILLSMDKVREDLLCDKFSLCSLSQPEPILKENPQNSSRDRKKRKRSARNKPRKKRKFLKTPPGSPQEDPKQYDEPSEILLQQCLGNHTEQQKNLAKALATPRHSKISKQEATYKILAWRILFNRQVSQISGSSLSEEQVMQKQEVDYTTYAMARDFVSLCINHHQKKPNQDLFLDWSTTPPSHGLVDYYPDNDILKSPFLADLYGSF